MLHSLQKPAIASPWSSSFFSINNTSKKFETINLLSGARIRTHDLSNMRSSSVTTIRPGLPPCITTALLTLRHSAKVGPSGIHIWWFFYFGKLKYVEGETVTKLQSWKRSTKQRRGTFEKYFSGPCHTASPNAVVNMSSFDWILEDVRFHIKFCFVTLQLI